MVGPKWGRSGQNGGFGVDRKERGAGSSAIWCLSGRARVNEVVGGL